MTVELSPSIMCVNYLEVRAALRTLDACGVRWLHADVMDGVFAPGFTFGRDFVRAVRSAWPHNIDLHLMSARPREHLEQFLDTGVDVISVHVEHADHRECLQSIAAAGIAPSIALSPDTPVSRIDHLLNVVDGVLVMGVFPGSVGAPMSTSSAGRVRDVRDRLAAAGRASLPITFDGGVSTKTIGALAAAGAYRLVSGSAIFHAADIGTAVADLLAAATLTIKQGEMTP